MKIRQLHAVTGASVLMIALCLTGVAVAGSAHHATAAKVSVTLVNGSLHLSNTNLEAGLTTFVVVNKAKGIHAFEISGPGVRNAHTPKLDPGATASLTVKLKAGAYMVADPLSTGFFATRYLAIAPSAVETAKGNGSVVNTSTVPASMCSTPEINP
jgi:hypothetical protein